MGALQSVVEMLAFRPPPHPKVAPPLPYGAEEHRVRARYSYVPLYVLRGTSRSRRDDASGTAESIASGAHDAYRTWIILSHGTSEDCSTAILFGEHLAHALGVNVIMYEYPGYGMSAPIDQGPQKELPSEVGVFAAAHAAYTFATDVARVDPGRIVAMGWSIGSGPTMELAASHNIAGAVLQSAFRSVIRTRVWTPWSLGCDILHNEDKIERVSRDTRILILHGTEDTLVPVKHAYHMQGTLAARGIAHGNGVWMRGRGHGDVTLDDKYLPAIREFLASVRDSASGFGNASASASASGDVTARRNAAQAPAALEMAYETGDARR